MKVVRVSSYDHEDHRGNQRVVAGPGLSAEEASGVAARMNEDPKRWDEDYFVVKEDDYVCWKFEA